MKLHKSIRNRVLMGVCGGIAETRGVSAGLVRFLFILVSLLMPRVPVFLIYLLMGFLLPYGGPEGGQHTSSRGGPFGGGARPYGGSGRQGRPAYKPKAPPFDVSDAQDVEVDCRHEDRGYSEEDYYRASRETKDEDYDR